MDPLTALLQVAFYVLFAATIYRWIRRRGPLELAVALVFAPLAALFLLSLINTLAPALAPTLRPILILILFLQPWFVVRLVDQIRPVAPRVSLVVLLGGVACTVAVSLFNPVPPLLSLTVVVFFFAVQAAAAGRLAMDSRRRAGVARVRLAVASLATALFGVALLVSGATSAANGGATVATAQVVTRAMLLVAAVGFLVAFVPPDALRRFAYRAMAFDLMRTLVAPTAGVETGRLWADLAATAHELLGARRVSILSASDGLPLATVGLPQAAIEPVDHGGARPDDRSGAANGVIGRLRAAIASKPAIVSKVEVPLRDPATIRSKGVPREHLVAEVEGRPLFVEDDVALLSMLGQLTARAVDREEALITLGQARNAIEESAAIKASESRFRALLEADPNAILAMDEHQAVVWATRQAGDLFGATTEELIGKPLAELVAVPHDLRPSGTSEPPVYRADTTGRRLDGTHFPAELARAAVEIDGRPFELAVVSDVSWRQEAAQIRDRFLGVLSHELRTPVTSIYGGTQLLLGRGARLDEETRNELLVGVAAESERLQRMIENLVALARIERGAEFAPSRPVLIDRVISDLVRRERPLWPEVSIRLHIAAPVQMVSADEEYLGQVVRNLLSNAAKYGGEGTTVDVEVVDAENEVHVLVRDDGPGIAAEDSDKLFGLYYRSAHVAASAPGAGIGLFICRELVSIMGGRMWANARPERGAEFGFSLPAYVEEPEPEFEMPNGLAARVVPAPEAAAPAPASAAPAPATANGSLRVASSATARTEP